MNDRETIAFKASSAKAQGMTLGGNGEQRLDIWTEESDRAEFNSNSASFLTLLSLTLDKLLSGLQFPYL